MANFEVYFGTGGVWTRVALEGATNDTTAIIKNAADIVRATVTDTTINVRPLLLKVGSDALLTLLVDAGVMVASGTTAKPGSDIVRPTLTETATVFVTRPASTDVDQPQIVDTSSLIKTTVGGTSGIYGSGTYGSGPYGQGGGTSTSTPLSANDADSPAVVDAGTVVATTLVDTFARTASTTTMGSFPGRSAYTPLQGTWGITADQKAYAVTANDYDIVVTESGTINWDISMTVERVANGDQGLVGAVVDSSTFFLVEVNGTGSIYFGKFVADTPTGYYLSAANAVVNGDVVRMRRTGGNQIAVFINGTLLHQTGANEPGLQNTRVGLRHGASAAGIPIRFPDFRIGAP